MAFDFVIGGSGSSVNHQQAANRGTPEGMSTHLKSEVETWARVVKDANAAKR